MYDEFKCDKYLSKLEILRTMQSAVLIHIIGVKYNINYDVIANNERYNKTSFRRRLEIILSDYSSVD